MKKPAIQAVLPSAASICPVRTLLDQLADRWAVLVILALADAPVRFNSLRRIVDGVTQKVLGQTLRRLERNGLVQRNVIASKPIAVEYKLTKLGESLLLTIKQLREWALANALPLASARVQYDQDQGGTAQGLAHR